MKLRGMGERREALRGMGERREASLLLFEQSEKRKALRGLT
jgi:hypothetical protein